MSDYSRSVHEDVHQSDLPRQDLGSVFQAWLSIHYPRQAPWTRQDLLDWIREDLSAYEQASSRFFACLPPDPLGYESCPDCQREREEIMANVRAQLAGECEPVLTRA